MFPARLLETRAVDDERIEPVWLVARDDVWLRELVAEARACDGRRLDVADERIRDHVVPLARRHRIAARVVAAVWAVERRRWKTRIDSRVPPIEIRRLLFELGAERDRAEALATTAATLGLDVGEVERSLFADRARAKLLVAPRVLPSEIELRDAYNLAVAQTLLARSVEVAATVKADLRAVVRYAKLLGLMVTFGERTADGTRVSISGPLSVFHQTTKYSRAFATWFPALVATPGWSLEASVVVDGETKRLLFDGGAPIPRTHALPKAHDSRLEADLETAIRELASPLRLVREADVVQAGERLFFPDFALESDRGRVVVEVAGFWSPEYLAAKLELLRAVGVPFVMCADRKIATSALVNDPRVLVFDGAVDARALLDRGMDLLGFSNKERVLRCEESWASEPKAAPGSSPTSTTVLQAGRAP